ncbi:MAG: zinc ribbon domain-containing protein [Spirochaetales bacterium]|jgi:hypothetical protein|nr:zinc ribbon domain-containing protein [Spirochaetales bacterium]
MKCRKCRREIPDDAQFCHYCGYDILQDALPPQPGVSTRTKLVIAGIAVLALIIAVWRIAVSLGSG